VIKIIEEILRGLDDAIAHAKGELTGVKEHVPVPIPVEVDNEKQPR